MSEAVVTNYGIARFADANSGGAPVQFVTMVVGDGGGVPVVPDPAQTDLVNQVYSQPVNLVAVDPGGTNRILVEAVVPPFSGPWTAREIGVLDQFGELVLLASTPEIEAPGPGSDASTQIVFRIPVQVDNTADVTLTVDLSTVLVTRDTFDAHVDDVVKHSEALVLDSLSDLIARDQVKHVTGDSGVMLTALLRSGRRLWKSDHRRPAFRPSTGTSTLEWAQDCWCLVYSQAGVASVVRVEEGDQIDDTAVGAAVVGPNVVCWNVLTEDFAVTGPASPAEAATLFVGLEAVNSGTYAQWFGGCDYDDDGDVMRWSCWDEQFRPACPDPRGMVLVDGRFWSNIYLSNRDAWMHQDNGGILDSLQGAAVASESESPLHIYPYLPRQGVTRYTRFLWFEATLWVSQFGKRFPTWEEFIALADGATSPGVPSGSFPAQNSTPMLPSGTVWDFASRWGVVGAVGLRWQYLAGTRMDAYSSGSPSYETLSDGGGQQASIGSPHMLITAAGGSRVAPQAGPNNVKVLPIGDNLFFDTVVADGGFAPTVRAVADHYSGH